jgi:pimeloyl-ACP methyl ester carboxylesterase
VPVRVVWGEEDALSLRAEQDLMLAAVPGADLVVLEGIGHLANVEDPPAVTAAMLGLLEAVRGQRSS